jgi:SHS2 domain-containing protein
MAEMLKITDKAMNSKPEMRNPKQKYRIFDHTADLGLEIYGTDEKELFLNAAIAVFDNITELGHVSVKETRHFSVEGSDREDLLINFFREILYMYNGEGFLLKDCSISAIDDRHVIGTVRGEVFDPEKHRIKKEIKAVTYHQIEVDKTPHGWKGRVIFDV